MADFSWLNDIPQDSWDKHGLGFSRSFDAIDFYKRCGLAQDAAVFMDFDAWGLEEPRGYEIFPRPGGKIVIAWGDWPTASE